MLRTAFLLSFTILALAFPKSVVEVSQGPVALVTLNIMQQPAMSTHLSLLYQMHVCVCIAKIENSVDVYPYSTPFLPSLPPECITEKGKQTEGEKRVKGKRKKKRKTTTNTYVKVLLVLVLVMVVAIRP